MTNANTSFSTGNVTVYFQSHRAGLNAELTGHLAEFIGGTEQALDCAIYDLRDPAILDAFVQLVNDGKQVRIVFDGGKQRSGGFMADPKPDGTELALNETRLIDYARAIHEGRYLMHDKFIVRDKKAVWTGSANFTQGGLELQDNHCLVLQDSNVAQRYTNAFEHLFSSDNHRNHQPAGNGSDLQNQNITPFFSPASQEGIEDVIVNALNGAKKSVRILAFLISDDGILNVLARLQNAPGIDLKGVYDPNGMKDVLRSTRQDPALFWFMDDKERFVAAPSHAFNPHREQDFMHNKVMIIDDHLVITGSYNFSENAESNDENLLVIDSPAMAEAYVAYFETLYTAYRRAA